MWKISRKDVSNLRQLMDKVGFEQVKITKVDLPHYLIDFLARSYDLNSRCDNDVQQLVKCVPYIRVETSLGVFGVFMATIIPMVDLTETGDNTILIMLGASELPPGVPPIIGVDSSEDSLKELKKAMEAPVGQIRDDYPIDAPVPHLDSDLVLRAPIVDPKD